MEARDFSIWGVSLGDSMESLSSALGAPTVKESMPDRLAQWLWLEDEDYQRPLLWVSALDGIVCRIEGNRLEYQTATISGPKPNPEEVSYYLPFLEKYEGSRKDAYYRTTDFYLSVSYSDVRNCFHLTNNRDAERGWIYTRRSEDLARILIRGST